MSHRVQAVVFVCNLVAAFGRHLSADATVQAGSTAAQPDVLLRSKEQKEEAEAIYHQSVAHRLGPVLEKGYDTEDVHLWAGDGRVCPAHVQSLRKRTKCTVHCFRILMCAVCNAAPG